MAAWTLAFHPAAAAEMAALPEKDYARVEGALLRLAEDPFHPRAGVDVRKLKGARTPGLYRLRVGARRVLYVAATARRELVVLVVDDRGLGYERLSAIADGRAP